MQRATLLAIISAILIASCGGTDNHATNKDPALAAADAATTYWKAVGSGDPGAICDSLSTQIRRAYRQIAGTCVTYVKRNHLGGHGERPGKPMAVEISGAQATVTLPIKSTIGSTITHHVRLARQDGTWKVVRTEAG
jgi:hypothetical protein